MTNPVWILTTLALCAAPSSEYATPIRGAAPRHEITLVEMSSIQRHEVERVVALFDDAGLELPPVTIRHDSDRTACQNREGLHRRVEGRSEIELCTSATGAWEEEVILHELAHAWSAHFLGAERKAAFQDLRGLDHWQDYEAAAWRYNGTEQAAEIFVWALSDHPVRIARIDHNFCAELLAGYVTLTGLKPLHGYTELCDDEPVPSRS